MTKRLVSVEIVYDGDLCSRDCDFFCFQGEVNFCHRHGVELRLHPDVSRYMRCDECKAEDARYPHIDTAALYDSIAARSVPADGHVIRIDLSKKP